MTAATSIADPVLDVVERIWGFSSLRPLQRQAIDAALAGRDSLLVVPTGAGKSLCFQVPALLEERLTVVVSPLIALMKDQVDALRSSGVAAAALNSTTAVAEQRAIEQAAVDGSLRLLFVSPERLATASLRALLGRARVRAFAIDEAHCISHWGHDFRPEYRQLRELSELFPDASLHAFTATATAQVRADICSELHLRDPLILVGDLDRPNLRYRVVPRTDEVVQIENVIRRHPGEAGIVYCIRRKDVDSVAAALAGRGHRVTAYHAGMGPDQRREAQDAFASERVDIVVATVAFGMGIDRSNVRFVIHAGLPKSIEHYQQEAGRAGRDGLAAECVLLYDGTDALTWSRILGQSVSDDDQFAIAMSQLEAMNRFCASGVCRHRTLVEHFGGAWTLDQCDACDICLGELESVTDSTLIAQKILSCVVRVGQTFGATHVASVLRGERSSRIVTRGHDSLSTFGILADHSSEQLRGWITQLVASAALIQDAGARPVLRLGPAARAILRGEREMRLLQTSSTTIRDGAEEWAGVDRELFETLRTWRRETAAAHDVAPFVILGDETLRDLSAKRPSSLERLRQIAGIGEMRFLEHGAELLRIIDGCCSERELERDVALVRRTSRERARGSRPTAAKTESLRLLEQGATIEEAMERSGRARSTVVGDLCEMIEDGRYQPASLRLWMSEEIEDSIRRAAREVGTERLRPIRDITGDSISYEQIHIVVATLRAPLPALS